jgi:spermidine dehydrogenase
MGREITRRDFIHGLGLATLGLGLPWQAPGTAAAANPPGSSPAYPPILTGMRGSHPGSFEVAHVLAREGRRFSQPRWLDETYDLVVVGGGISGLASAYYYRKAFGPAARILVLENHDDFGGHARRNEFHQGGAMRLAWGGVFNLEYPYFSDMVNALLEELGVSIDRLLQQQDFHYGANGVNGPAVYFDKETFGRDVLLTGFALRGGDPESMLAQMEQVPLDAESVESLKNFYAARTDVLAGLSVAERKQFLHGTRYTDFIQQHGGLTEAAARLFVSTTHGYWGIGADGLSVAECEDAGLPMHHLLGGRIEGAGDPSTDQVAHFPDGNASIARLLVRELVPCVAPGGGMDDIAIAQFDYERLDDPTKSVRIRLNSTVVGIDQEGEGVSVAYVCGDELLGVRARHCVLACDHAIIPHLAPGLPEEQKQAMAYQVKRPLILTNVLLRNSEAADRLGISGAYCPGRLHGACWLVNGISSGGFSQDRDDPGASVMQFWGTVAPPDSSVHPHEQHRASRARLLAMTFDDFEREVRTVLDGMLGPAGFSAADDILAITVNRWPHGYSYDYLDLWDPSWTAGEAPHEIARRPWGKVVFANADAGADAYTHVAIEQAWRAVSELRAANNPLA